MGWRTDKFVADDGRELEIDIQYRIEDGAIEITNQAAWLWKDRNDSKAPNVSLTDKELGRIADLIAADPDTWRYDDDLD